MTDQPEPQFEWCFSTMGCPAASFDEAAAIARDFHFPAMELRSLSDTIHLPKLFSERGWTPETVRAICRENAVRIAVAGSSFKLISDSESERNELAGFCQWADSLGVPYVRVFGGGKWGAPLQPEDFQSAVRNISWWREKQEECGWRIEMLLETHDAFSSSDACLQLNEHLGAPLNLIWDSHHTWRYAKENVLSTWTRLGHLVRHVHVKDSVDTPSARHFYTYVLPGQGQVPLQEIFEMLVQNRFCGCVSLEWEKLWHPYLSPLEQALEALQSQPWFKNHSPHSCSNVVAK